MYLLVYIYIYCNGFKMPIYPWILLLFYYVSYLTQQFFSFVLPSLRNQHHLSTAHHWHFLRRLQNTIAIFNLFSKVVSSFAISLNLCETCFMPGSWTHRKSGMTKMVVSPGQVPQVRRIGLCSRKQVSHECLTVNLHNPSPFLLDRDPWSEWGVGLSKFWLLTHTR
jgi:hypothetical protein